MPATKNVLPVAVGFGVLCHERTDPVQMKLAGHIAVQCSHQKKPVVESSTTNITWNAAKGNWHGGWQASIV